MNTEKPRPIQGADKYIVRFPPGMRDKIAADAKRNGRSMNAEIVARLQVAEPARGQSTLIEAMARLNLDLSRAEIDVQRKSLELSALATKLRAAVRLLGRTQYAHDPNYEILAAQSDEAPGEDSSLADLAPKIDSAMTKYRLAIQELEKVKAST